jgi:predicted Zn-dependent protease
MIDDLGKAMRVESPARTRSKRFRFLRAFTILLILGAIGELGRRSSPFIHRELGLHLALRSVEAGRLDDAEPRLDALISENPRDTRPRLALVQVYRRLSRITEAEEALQRAVELGLSMEEARQEHALLRRLTRQPEGRSFSAVSGQQSASR